MRIALISSGCAVLAAGAALYVLVPAERLAPWLPGVVAAPKAAAPSAAPIPVKVAAATAADVPIYLQAIGTIQAYNTVNVKTRIDGEITQILFHEGQDVHQGDPLAVIDPRPLQAQLAQQQAMRTKDQALLDGAMLDMKRYDSLVAKDYASRQQVDQQHALVEQYRAQVHNDEAQIDYARTQLDYTTIRTPISGRAGIRQTDQGNVVHSADNTTIVTVTQLQPISVVFTVAAAALERTRLTLGEAHEPVAAIGQDDKTELDHGTIDLVDTQVDPSTGTIKLKASFPNAALKLWPGNFVNGRITVDDRKDGVTVPTAAVRHGPRGDYVWLVKADDTVKAQDVSTGQAYGGRTLVEKGLAQGERIVVEGYYRLDNGAKVEIQGAAGGPG
ncbi:MAG TPA: efflux RND transporter periplasmic adaptor subunit [Aliidongia sp.]|uniref:efflux RND transporter periplasmic adaptor subunit n=1 Tax=Aliidongia sp. TaxID=1914230 RepID=UPI002DDDB52A|nr:efflux RND transporter periplasmic adaptor subunit [Aliidongia sp.]HEV2678564.1 efflux RND transporter periplasmic adaptor subunit [Aliidongia sp.]